MLKRLCAAAEPVFPLLAFYATLANTVAVTIAMFIAHSWHRIFPEQVKLFLALWCPLTTAPIFWPAEGCSGLGPDCSQ